MRSSVGQAAAADERRAGAAPGAQRHERLADAVEQPRVLGAGHDRRQGAVERRTSTAVSAIRARSGSRTSSMRRSETVTTSDPSTAPRAPGGCLGPLVAIGLAVGAVRLPLRGRRGHRDGAPADRAARLRRPRRDGHLARGDHLHRDRGRAQPRRPGQRRLGHGDPRGRAGDGRASTLGVAVKRRISTRGPHATASRPSWWPSPSGWCCRDRRGASWSIVARRRRRRRSPASSASAAA